MDFKFLQILVVTLLLTLLPIITVAFLLDYRRAKVVQKLPSVILSGVEILFLGLAWVFGIIYILFFSQGDIRFLYAVISLIFLFLMFISKQRRQRMMILPKARWYVAIITAMILAIFLGVLLKNESLLIYGSILLSLIMVIEIWGRIFGLFK